MLFRSKNCPVRVLVAVTKDGVQGVRARWLLAPPDTSQHDDFIECQYEVMDIEVDDDKLPFLPNSILQCPVTMTAKQKRDTAKRRRRWIRVDHKRNVAAVRHCIQRFAGELMSESDDELPFTASQQDTATSTGVLPSADEVRLQKQQLAMVHSYELD